MRIRRVVVGIDFNEVSLAAARWAVSRLAPQAEVLLLHVVPVPRIPSYLPGTVGALDSLLGSLSSGLDAALQGFASTLGSPRVHCESRVGLPSEQLAEAARDVGADLVVVGRGRQRAGTWKQLGSTADRLLRRASTPVLIANRSLPDELRHVVAAVDDAPVGRAVLATASSLARSCSASLTALHVISDRLQAYAAAALAEPIEAHQAHAAAARMLEEAAQAWLREEARAAGASVRQTEIAVTRGDPGHEILASGARLAADLLVIGSQGADAVAASGVGNVTRFVLRGASCPVLVIGRNGLAAGPPGSARRRPKVLALPHGGQARLPTPPPAPPAAVHAARLAAVGE